jgi:hypothetical protein
VSLLVASGVGAVGIYVKFAAPVTNNYPAVILLAAVSPLNVVLPVILKSPVALIEPPTLNNLVPVLNLRFVFLFTPAFVSLSSVLLERSIL